MALVNEAQEKIGIYIVKSAVGSCKDINYDNWHKLVDSYASLQETAQTLHLDRAWLRKQEKKHGYGWTKDNTRPECRGEAVKANTLKQLESRYSREELEALAKGRSTPLVNSARKMVDFTGETLTIGYYTDTHIGSKYFSENWFRSMWDEFKRQKIDMAIHSGDVFEGMTARLGHVFECGQVGFQAQKEYGTKIYTKYAIKKPHYFIDGNHDRWFSKANGANIVADFCTEMKYTYLGQDEGDIILDKYGITIRAWHGEDGNSYATSYRIQKIVESFSGGEKPHVLLTGHTHKALYALIRNIHCISGGAMSRQSKWMRGKRIENHAGFWVIKIGLGKNDVKWVEPRFYPFYK
jgi:predicted phosphodiesterase